MIQKITLEIQNDTGVEFEDTTKWDCPKEGEYFINSRHKIEKSDRFSSCYHYVLTPKIDAELEEAKKLIGKWVRYKDRDIAFKLTDVVRDSYSKEILGVVLNSIDSEKYYFKDLTPFPLPTWRCCASDKPKKSGEYAMRSKGSKKIFSVKYSIATAFWDRTSVIDCPYSDYEWLDEGER